MNSIVGSIFNIFSAWIVLWTVINSASTVIFVSGTHVKLLFTREKKEKEKPENVKHGRSFQWNPNGLNMWLWRLVSIFKLFTSALCLISLSFWFIRFYVIVEGEPYKNGGGRAMEEKETCSGWERESREKNISIFGIRDRYRML